MVAYIATTVKGISISMQFRAPLSLVIKQTVLLIRDRIQKENKNERIVSSIRIALIDSADHSVRSCIHARSYMLITRIYVEPFSRAYRIRWDATMKRTYFLISEREQSRAEHTHAM